MAWSIYEVIRTFKGYREDASGQVREVTVEVWQAGPGAPYRYVVDATDEGGRVATGNGGDSIDTAIATTHWEKLDRD